MEPEPARQHRPVAEPDPPGAAAVDAGDVAGVRDVDDDRRRRGDRVRHRAGAVHQRLLHHRRSGHERHAQATGRRRPAGRLQHHPGTGAVVERARREPPVRELGRRAVDHERVADRDQPERLVGVARPDVDPEIGDPRRAIEVGLAHQMARPLADHAGHVAGPRLHDHVLADQHLRVPGAEGADAQQPVVVGVPRARRGSRSARSRPGARAAGPAARLGPDAGERVAEDIAGDAREGARVPAPRRPPPPPRDRRVPGPAAARRGTRARRAAWPGRYHQPRVVEQRIVITGIGALTPVGNTIDATWQALLQGESGLGPVTLFDPSRIGCEVAAEVKGFDVEAMFGRREARKMDRVTGLSMAAAREAWANAGTPQVEPSRGGVIFGTAVGGMQMVIDQAAVLAERPGPAVAALPAELPGRHADQLHRHRPHAARPELRRRLGLRHRRPRDRRGVRHAPPRRGGRDAGRRRRVRRARGAAGRLHRHEGARQAAARRARARPRHGRST